MSAETSPKRPSGKVRAVAAIIHAYADQPMADRLARRLEALGYQVIRGDEVDPANADCTLALWSQAAAASGFFLRQVEAAPAPTRIDIALGPPEELTIEADAEPIRWADAAGWPEISNRIEAYCGRQRPRAMARTAAAHPRLAMGGAMTGVVLAALGLALLTPRKNEETQTALDLQPLPGPTLITSDGIGGPIRTAVEPASAPAQDLDPMVFAVEAQLRPLRAPRIASLETVEAPDALAPFPPEPQLGPIP
jgi:hypothetical protein